jgi:hypothetical protein
MRSTAALLLACLCAAPAAAQAPRVGQAHILWAGTYRAAIVGTVEQPGTAIGKTNRLGPVRKLETTTVIRARLGASFGFEYRLTGTPPGAQATVDVVVLLPGAGLLNPATGKRTFREQWRPSPNTLGETRIVGYQLERDWEIVYGLWTFQVWHDGRKLAEQQFCLVPDQPPSPERSEDLKKLCHSAATA